MERRLVRANTTPSLFPYQWDLVRKAQIIISDRSAALLSLPTGGGKTRTAAMAVLTCLVEGTNTRVVWLAPTIELLDQAVNTFELLWRETGKAPDLTLTRRLDRKLENVIWFTTPHAVNAVLNRSKRLGRWDVVVFDEAHQLAARTYKAAVDTLRATSESTPAPLLGLSATPGRVEPTETEDLLALFGRRLLRSERLGDNPVSTLQTSGVLARLSFRKFTARSIPRENEVERLEIAARAARELFSRGRHLLIFTASVAGAYLLQDVLRGFGVPARAIDSDSPTSERLDALAAFASREIAVLINQRLLATGYDCPAVTDVFLLPEIRSPILFEQMVGRAARGPRTGGSAVATVWEFDNHLELHGLPSSYYRYRDYDWS